MPEEKVRLIPSKDYLEATISWAPPNVQICYQGKVQALSSQNGLGPFDVLPEHENFISYITNQITVYTLDQKKLDYTFKQGLLEVSQNQVKVFLEN